MGTIINNHNTCVCGAGYESDDQFRCCNCWEPDHWSLTESASLVASSTKRLWTPAAPLQHHCSTIAPKIYIGSTEILFKQQLANHLTSFKYKKYENRTELSTYIWKLKHKGETFRISWSILRRASAYSSLSKRCNLCLMEKLMILSEDRSTLLNKRSELVSKCRHQNKFALSNFVSAVTWSFVHAHIICVCAHVTCAPSLVRTYQVFTQALYLKV